MSDVKETPQPEETPNPSTPDTPQGSNGGNEGTFTQEDIDRISTRVRHETRDIERKKLLEDLGIDDLDSLKSFVNEARERKQAQMSELEKAQAKIADAEKKALEAQQKLTEMQQQRIADARKAAFTDAIRTSGSDSGNHLYVLMSAEMPELFEAVFDGDNTTPDEGKMKALVKEVQNKFPMFFGSAGAGSPSNAHGVNPTSTIEAQKQAAAEVSKKFKI